MTFIAIVKVWHCMREGGEETEKSGIIAEKIRKAKDKKISASGNVKRNNDGFATHLRQKQITKKKK